MQEKIVELWDDSQLDWIDYSIQELGEYFNFVNKPNWEKVREIYLHNSGFNTWMEIIFNNNSSNIYNKVHGTFVEQ